MGCGTHHLLQAAGERRQNGEELILRHEKDEFLSKQFLVT